VKFSTGLGIAGMKEELTIGLLLLKFAAELAKGLVDFGGKFEGKAVEPAKLFGVILTGVIAEDPVNGFL
jgi:hypothetical protein